MTDENPTPEQVSDLIARLLNAAEFGPEGFSGLFVGAATTIAALREAPIRKPSDRWFTIVDAVERAVDQHAFDDEDGNGFVPIGPLHDALNWENATA